MNIDQIINEDTEQLDELSWQDVKSGAANTLGAIGKGIGGIASVPQGIARAVKAGYKDGVDAIGGPEGGTDTQPAGSRLATAGIESQIKQKEQELADLKGQLLQAKQHGASSDPVANTNGTTQQSLTQTTSTEKPASAVGNNIKGAGNSVANAIKGAQAAVQAGVGMGAAGQSLMTPKAGDDVQSVKDAQGKEHQYKKVGQQWVNMADNTPVDPATAAMLNRQAKQKTAATAANAEMDKTAQPQAKLQAKPGTQKPQAKSQPQSPAQPTTGAQQPQAQQPAATATTPATPAGQQPAQAQAGAEQPAAKAHTGGKVAGQVSQTPNAIRKREQRAAKAAPNDVMARMAKQLGQAPAGTPAQDGKQPAPATPDYSKLGNGAFAGYGKTTYNAPTGGVPQQPAVQPTTGAKAVPAEQPAQAPAQTKQDQIDADAHQWFNQRRTARNQSQVSFDDWKQNYRGKPMGPIVQPAQGVQTPAAPNFGTPPAPTPAATPTASAQADANKPGFLQSKIKGSQVPANQPEMAGTDFSAILARKAQIKL